MLSIFMFILIIISFMTIYLEVKKRERADKIFYTFYLFGMSVVIFPFFKVFNSIMADSIFIIIYSIIIYGIYSDFEMFTKFIEIFLVYKKVDSKELIKVDYKFLDTILNQYKQIIKSYNIKIYHTWEYIFDKILIVAWILSIWILLYSFIIK